MLTYSIITPDGEVASGEAAALTLSTQSGEITLLPGHVALATLLRAGEARVRTSGNKEEILVLSSGFLNLEHDKVTILADIAERAENLEVAAIEEAIARAKSDLQAIRNTDTVEYTNLAARLEHELARQRVAVKRGRAKEI